MAPQNEAFAMAVRINRRRGVHPFQLVGRQRRDKPSNGPAHVFEAASDGEQGVGVRFHPVVAPVALALHPSARVGVSGPSSALRSTGIVTGWVECETEREEKSTVRWAIASSPMR